MNDMLDQTMKTRYATKRYDASFKLSSGQKQKILDLLRFSPSSVNSQPWHYVLVQSDQAKQQILPGVNEFNQAKVLDSALTIVFCRLSELNDKHLDALLNQEQQDQRFTDEAKRQAQQNGRQHFINLNSDSRLQQQAWMERQLYLSLGFLLLGSAELGLDATPIEGIDCEKLDQVLELQKKGLNSVVIACIGRAHQDDFNRVLPKSRLAVEQVFTEL